MALENKKCECGKQAVVVAGENFLCDECYEKRKKDAKFLRDKAILKTPGHKLADGTQEGKATAVMLAGIDPGNYDKVVGKPPEQKIVLMSKFSPVPFADRLMEDGKFLFDNYKRFWRYDPRQGIWIEDAEMYIKHRLRKLLMGEEQQKKNYIEEVVSYVKDTCWSKEELNNPPENIIAFENCLFDIEKEEIIDFSPDYFITTKMPILIDSKFDECPMIDQFFEDCVGKEKKQVLYELFAYCMLRAYPYQKFFLLYGRGENGKSVFLNLLRNFLGVENVSNETPQNLVTNQFSRGRLWNKLANIGSDIPYVSLQNTNIIKELTGEDAINCERKFKEPFPFVNYAKLIWSSNELPQVNDKTYAFYRRVYILPFEHKIDDPDPFILRKISTSEQMSGLAWVCIKLLKNLKKENYIFSSNPSVQEMETMYEDLSNPLNKFLRERTQNKINGKIAKWEFNEKFVIWLKDNGFRIWGDKEINGIMKEKYQEGRVEVFGEEINSFGKPQKVTKHYRCWDNIAWKPKKSTTKPVKP